MFFLFLCCSVRVLTSSYVFVNGCGGWHGSLSEEVCGWAVSTYFPLTQKHTLRHTHTCTHFPCQVIWSFPLKAPCSSTDVEAISFALIHTYIHTRTHTPTRAHPHAHTHIHRKTFTRINTKTHSLLGCGLPLQPRCSVGSCGKRGPVRGCPKIAWAKMQERGARPVSHRKIYSSVCVSFGGESLFLLIHSEIVCADKNTTLKLSTLGKTDCLWLLLMEIGFVTKRTMKERRNTETENRISAYLIYINCNRHYEAFPSSFITFGHEMSSQRSESKLMQMH